MLAATHCPVFEYTPRAMKQAVTDGNASKADIQTMVQHHLIYQLNQALMQTRKAGHMSPTSRRSPAHELKVVF